MLFLEIVDIKKVAQHLYHMEARNVWPDIMTSDQPMRNAFKKNNLSDISKPSFKLTLMKNYNHQMFLLAVGCMLTACQGAHKDSPAKADSVNEKFDSLNNKQAGTGDRAISGPDAKFAVEAADGGMAEVELGKLAQEKGANGKVKDFGGMMVKDHSMANMELKELAKVKRITLPDSISLEEQKLKTKLAAKSGAEFDKAYVEAMVEDHKKDIAAFEEARLKVKYPEMTALIDKALPMLKMHLRTIEEIQKQINK
jgi:putative membrane protein